MPDLVKIDLNRIIQEFDRVNVMLALLKSYAPNVDIQNKCSSYVREMLLADLNSDQIITELASALLDGLRHGNWFWNHV